MNDINTSLMSDNFNRELEAFLRSQKAQRPPEPAEEKPQAFWEQLFKEMNFPGMDLMAVTYFNLSSDDLLEQRGFFRKSMRAFLKLLGESYENDLRSAGVSEEGIFQWILRNRSTPQKEQTAPHDSCLTFSDAFSMSGAVC